MKISYKRWSGIPYVLYIGNHKLWKIKMIYVLEISQRYPVQILIKTYMIKIISLRIFCSFHLMHPYGS